jgi:hypothetical protein
MTSGGSLLKGAMMKPAASATGQRATSERTTCFREATGKAKGSGAVGKSILVSMGLSHLSGRRVLKRAHKKSSMKPRANRSKQWALSTVQLCSTEGR